MTHPYHDPSLPVPARVADLLSRMTLEEKVAQLHGLPRDESIEDDQKRFSPSAAQTHIPHGIAYVGGLGTTRGPREAAEFANALQKYLREQTRLGIPALNLGEALHGFMALEATSFPQAIGLASTWDPDLVERALAAAAREMRAQGAQYALSPVLDIARDPRWGRTEETYGEDPHLAARMGVAAIRGLQGVDGVFGPERVLATAKHFAVHGQPEGGTNAAPGNYAERVVREQFLIPFQAAVEEAGVGSVMASYNEIDGIPSHINPWLLQRVLREEWGFAGLVLSDGWGVDDLYRLHFVAADAADAARQAVMAGIQLELGYCFTHLVEAVRSGNVPGTHIDDAVSSVLAAKFALGLFEDPFVDPQRAADCTNCADHQALALEAACKAIVLLKNESGLLPLDESRIRSIAVIGQNAAELRLGGYAGTPGHSATILDGIRSRAGDRIAVEYAEGCRITETQGRSSFDLWKEETILLPDPAEETARIAAAVAAAKRADVAVLVLGENEQTCREGWSATHLGDRDSLDLPGRQEELLRAVVETGTPVVLLLVNGRPLSVNFAAQNVPSVLECWYPGQEGGTAVAGILFGDVNPGGKLPISFPRSVGQIPAYYYHKPSARRGYVLADHTPLYPFGHGMSYTSFRLTNLGLSPERIPMDGRTTLRVDVTNSGARAGDEVIQLYVRDRLASLPRPVKELKDFRRITLEPGETQTVEFTLTAAQLSFLDAQMNRVVEPGLFDVMVGSSSVQCETAVLEITAGNT